MTSSRTTRPGTRQAAPATGTTGPNVFSPAGTFLRGVLLTYLWPRLSPSAQPYCMAMVDQPVRGLTSRNFGARRQLLIDLLTRLTQGKFRPGPGMDITDLPFLLAVLAPEIERADRTTLAIIHGGHSGESSRPPTAPASPPAAARPRPDRQTVALNPLPRVRRGYVVPGRLSRPPPGAEHRPLRQGERHPLRRSVAGLTDHRHGPVSAAAAVVSHVVKRSDSVVVAWPSALIVSVTAWS